MLSKKLFPIAIFLIIIGFMWKGLYLNQKSNSGAIELNSKDFNVPNFNLYNLNTNSNLTRAIFKDKVTIVRIWASWCGYCKKQSELFKSIGDIEGVQFVGINFNDNNKNAIKFLKSYGNPFKYNIIDHDGVLSISMGVTGTPETFLIDKKGKIRFKYLGPLTKADFDAKFMPVIEKLKQES